MSQVGSSELAILPPADPLPGFRRIYFAMTAIDALGSGLFMTVSIFFWIRYAHFGVEVVGLGFTLGGLTAMVAMVPLGRLGDRIGSRRLAVALNVAAAVILAAFPLVHQTVAFFVAMGLATAAQSSLGPLRRAYVGTYLTPEIRRPFNARNRATFNAGFGIGAAVAGAGLALGDTRTLVYLVLADAASFFLAGLAMWRLPRDRRVQAVCGTGGLTGILGALAHPKVFASGAVIGLLALCNEALDIGIPVWIATTSRVPVWMISGGLILNTIFVVAFQVPAARWLQRFSMRRNCYLSSGLLASAFALLALDGFLHHIPAIILSMCSVLLLSCSEIGGSVVDWEVSYSHARPGRESEFQAAFSLGTSSHQLVGGVLFSGPIAALGSMGWLVACAAPILVAGTNAFHRTRGLTG